MGVYKGGTLAQKVYVGNTLIWPNMKRIFHDFTGVPNGALPSGWSKFGSSVGPEIYADHIRNSPSTKNNTNNQSIALYTGDKVSTDNQIIRGKTRSAINGLLGGIILRADSTYSNSVLFLLSTGSSGRGIWTNINGSVVQRTNGTTSGNIGDTWAFKAEGNVYTAIRNPNPDNTGGTVVATWTDTGNLTKTGPAYRYGGFGVNSDRNFFGTQNWGPGFDNFDFRDLGWTA